MKKTVYYFNVLVGIENSMLFRMLNNKLERFNGNEWSRVDTQLKFLKETDLNEYLKSCSDTTNSYNVRIHSFFKEEFYKQLMKEVEYEENNS